MCQRKILFLLGNRAKVTHPPPMFKGLMNPFWQQSILVNIVQAQSELSTDLASLDLAVNLGILGLGTRHTLMMRVIIVVANKHILGKGGTGHAFLMWVTIEIGTLHNIEDDNI